jgi:hypothetical protein
MGNTRDFVLEMKKSMQLLPTQRFTKGIGSYDINFFLHTLCREYKSLGRNVQFTWLKIGRNKSLKHRGFTGGSIEKLVLSRKGQYVLFGKAKLKNSIHRAFIIRLKKEKKEKLRFIIYSNKARGKCRANHAVGISVDDHLNALYYDNACIESPPKFEVMRLAEKMSDISNCYVFNIFEA